MFNNKGGISFIFILVGIISVFYCIKRYKLKNPRYLGTFCVDGKQTAKIHLYMVSIYWSASLRISSV